MPENQSFFLAGHRFMEDQSRDIFESDQAFIEVASIVLLVVGLISLTFVLLCKFFGWGVCDLKWVPLFGGFNLGRADLLAINLPLALLILGIGIRLYTGFGWTTSLLLLLILSISFGSIAWKLISSYGEYTERINANEILPQDYPIVESIAVNLVFGTVCLLGIVFLSLPSVRKIYWRPTKDSSTPSEL